MRGATAREPDYPQSLSTVQWTHEEPGKVFRGSRAPQAPRFETSISQKSTVDAGGTPVRPQTDHLRWCWKSAPGPSIASVNTWRYQFSSTSMNGAGGRVPEGACRGAESGLCVECGPLLSKHHSRLSSHVFFVFFNRNSAWRTNREMKFTKRRQQHIQHNAAALPCRIAASCL